MRRLTPPAKGFTLIELLVAIAIVGILVVQGLPAFQEMVANSRLRSGAEALQTTALWARNEAIKRNTTVQLLSDGTQLSVVAGPASATPEVLRTVPLSAPAATASFTFSYSSSGLAFPFGAQQTVSVSQGVTGCGAALRCPGVLLGSGGNVQICSTGTCP